MADTKKDRYELLYHPGIPGRAEPIRLVLEHAGAKYVDVCNEDKSQHKAMFTTIAELGHLAPPLLRVGEDVISQSPAILAFLGQRLGLAPQDDVGRARALQLTLTALDLQNEAHTYEQQKDAALEYSKAFVAHRLAKYLTSFERALKASGSDYLLDKLSYADLAVAQVVDGLQFAFPKATAKQLESHPLVAAHKDRIFGLPRIKAYLESDRRLPYSNGVYRRYPELDG